MEGHSLKTLVTSLVFHPTSHHFLGWHHIHDIVNIYFLDIFISSDSSPSAIHFHRHTLELFVTWNFSSSEYFQTSDSKHNLLSVTLNLLFYVDIDTIHRFLHFLSLSQHLFVFIPCFPGWYSLVHHLSPSLSNAFNFLALLFFHCSCVAKYQSWMNFFVARL